ncbi:MAG: hypothetical protein A2Z08_03065 [Deltaproteobacteria bacterium RBG_16_54_11]|nr:MAG: hypothetical protein A2Z08_03065 [Deltaproteobacteria bacterium RBG_16_54_11]
MRPKPKVTLGQWPFGQWIWLSFPLTAALRHLPLAGPRILPKGAPPACYVLWSGAGFPDLCKASLSAFIEILMRGCRCATERDIILSPRGGEI